jgi:hypothetical protein
MRNRLGRTTCSLAALLFRLALCGGAPVLAQPAESGPSPWPRAVIVVFERRVPPGLSDDRALGLHLGELREKVIAELDGMKLQKGDHVFVFSDGTSQSDFQCAVLGSCSGSVAAARAPRMNESIAAVRQFLASMLQLPVRPGHTNPASSHGADGQEFLHLVYGGDLHPIDCAIRYSITAPMTSGYDRAAPCPAERPNLDRNQTRAVSRVEISFPLEVGAAMDALGKNSKPSEIFWVWALLGQKVYNSPDTVPGIRRDFTHAEAVVDFFERAKAAYNVGEQKTPTHFDWGGTIDVYSLTSRTTEKAIAGLVKDPGELMVSFGSGQRIPLAKDQEITTGVFGGEWKPRVDEFSLFLKMAPQASGDLLSARLDEFDGGRLVDDMPPANAASGDIELHAPHADSHYQRIIHSDLREKGTAFESRIDALIAGAPTPAPYNFPAIPSVYSLRRHVEVLRPAAGARELAIPAALIVIVAWIIVLVLRPHSFELALAPAPFRWSLPCTPGSLALLADLRGHAATLDRRWFPTSTMTQVWWEFCPPQGLPVLWGRSPVAVCVGSVLVPPLQWQSVTGRWQPGSPAAPTVIQPLSMVLNPAAFDSRPFTSPGTFPCWFHFQVAVAAKGRLSLRSACQEFWIPAIIELKSVKPLPKVSVEVIGSYRRLGFADPVGGVIGTVVVENPSPDKGIARAVESRLAIEVKESTGCRIVFDEPGEPFTHECVLKSGTRVSVDVALVKSDSAAPPEPRRVHFVVTASFLDKETGEVYQHEAIVRSFDWIPVSARVAGLDLGTSGTRLFLENPGLLHNDRQVLFPMTAVNEGDNSELAEFPSLICLDGPAGVVRAGSNPQFGVFAHGSGRRIESAKASLLDALGKPEEVNARTDFEQYVRALGKTWSLIRARENVDYAQFVLTIPWSYSKELARWYEDLVRRHFARVAMVSTVREAEAAAYFHLLRQRFVFDPAASPVPHNRKHYTLVIDAGAGTIDFAVIAASAPESELQQFAMVAWACSHFAGDRYDECMFAHVFDQSDAVERIAAEQELRVRLRSYKENHLPGLLSRAASVVPKLLVGTTYAEPVIHTEQDFLKSMEDWFRPAFSVPLEKIAGDLGPSEPVLDEVLLSGRGSLAYGCRQRVEQDVKRLFSTAAGLTTVPIKTFRPEQLTEVIARGALSFARKMVRIDDADLAASRDILLVVDFPDRPKPQKLVSVGDPLDDEGKTCSFGPFDRDICQAWILAGAPVLSEDGACATAALLRTGAAPADGVSVLAAWQVRAGVRRVTARIDSRERAFFVSAAPHGSSNRDAGALS